RQSPDSGLTSEPFAPAVHCWAPVPLQVQYCTFVPAEVPLEATSRQPPRTWSVPLDSTVQFWAPVPLQLQICTGAPAVVLELLSSTHRLEETPETIGPVAPPEPPEPEPLNAPSPLGVPRPVGPS